MEFLAEIYNGSSELEEQIFLNCCILKKTIRLLSNIYDEVRISKSELIFKILDPLNNQEILERLNTIQEELKIKE